MTIASVFFAFVISCITLNETLNGLVLNQTIYQWLVTGHYQFEVGFLIDNLTAMMMVVVTFVSLMVHIYTMGYMKGDPGYRRFFSYISLFTFSMLMLVMSNNFMQLFFGWEAVGLVSYLLIGFWFERPTAIYANLKAFLVNRVGDFGFILGIALILYWTGSLDYATVFKSTGIMAAHTMQLFGQPINVVTVICILLFIGAMGKSAQVPLHVWLPDSMEGPTPISALIHAATMVTAGVYLITRSNFVFDAAPTAQLLVVIVGAITLMFGALIGTAKDDIKKALAASTMSQIGYMILAAGLGPVGYAFAIMHLLTHGFFKAGMFLGAGSVMHGMNDEVNMRKYGALRKFMPITFVTFGLGYLAILGVPPFAGFYSKDMIIETAFNAGGAKGIILGVTTLIGAAITAFYMTRVMILTFTGTKRWDDDAHPHESPWLMWLPMAILAIGSVSSGFLLSRGDALENWLHPLFDHHEEHEAHLFEPIVVSAMALTMVAIGVAIAFVKYARQEVSSVAPENVSIFTKIARQDLMQDRFNEAVFMRPGQALTTTLVAADDAVIDGAVRGVGQVAMGSGSALRGLQNGYVRSYAAMILVGAIALIGAIWVVVQ